MNPAGPLTSDEIASNKAWWLERHAGFGEPRNREHYTLPKPATLTTLQAANATGNETRNEETKFNFRTKSEVQIRSDF